MYNEMFEYVKETLAGRDLDRFPFRKRFEHIERVFMWAKRLSDGMECVNTDALLTAAAFHDAGYGAAPKDEVMSHAEASALIFSEYAKTRNYDNDFIYFVSYLIKNHSSKHLLSADGTPIELILLMEADLLDETGALAIAWDCMAEGAETEQSFKKTYAHIINYSSGILEDNPMVTQKAKAFWEDKQQLVRLFRAQFAFDLGIES